MRLIYRIALALLTAVLFSGFGLALILIGKEGYVPKWLGISGAVALLPNLLLGKLGFQLPWELRRLEWVIFVLLQVGYCYGLVLAVELLVKKVQKIKAGSAAR